MDVITLEAAPRVLGKKGARATRREGRVPCVLYGHDVENVHFSVDDLSMHRLVFTDELHRLIVNLEGKSYDCIVKTVAMDPVRDEPIHADFQILVAGQAIELEVPISFVGTAKGHTDGGDVQQIIHELLVSCIPAHIPDSLEVDITNLEIGDAIHVSDLSFENIEIVTPPQQTVVAVTAKRVEEVVETPVDELEGVLGAIAPEDEETAD